MPLAFLPPIPPQPKRAEDLILDIEQVASGGARRDFAAIGRYVYRGDRRWIPPLPSARQFALRGNAAGFVATARNLGLGDEGVGAIAASAVASEESEGAAGRWGLLDALNVTALAERLFYAAETWLFENTPGIATLQGPASMEPLTPAGLLIDGFDAWPYALLPYNPPYYPELVEGEGYEQAGSWSVWTLECAGRSRAKAGGGSAVDWRPVWRAFAAAGYEDARAPGLTAWLAHLAGAELFPAHRSTRWVLARAFASAIHETSGGGHCLAIPDFAPALRLTGGRLFPVGYALFTAALARTRRLRVFPAWAAEDPSAARLGGLYQQLAAQAGAQGYRELVIGPIFDEDEESAEALTALGARARQRFAVYEKML